MTLINVVSAAVYLKGTTTREKVQTYALALIFLVLLYKSPSGLVIYWILNNLFSLVKNVVRAKCKNPAKLVHAIISAVLLLGSAYLLIFRPNWNTKKRFFVLGVAIIFALFPIIKKALKKVVSQSIQKNQIAENVVGAGSSNNFLIFIFSAIGLTLLVGLVLPLNVIATSPLEFSFVGNVSSPLTYVLYALTICVGFFLFWPLCIYKLFGTKVQSALAPIFLFLFITALLNVFVFKFDYGTMSVFFRFANPEILNNYSLFYSLFPFVISFILALALIFINRLQSNKANKITQFITIALISLVGAEIILSATKISNIQKEYTQYAQSRAKQGNDVATETELKPIYHLSKNGKNVVVFMLDRAISSFFPYIVKQFPELENKFDGFVYYPNTLSFASGTKDGAPAMCGGYEYTPENFQKRSTETDVQKHNEALLVLPRIFKDANFNVFVTDPPFSNYKSSGDSSPFDKFNISCKFVNKSYTVAYTKSHNIGTDVVPKAISTLVKKHIIAFSGLQTFFPILRHTLYNGSNYFQLQYNLQEVFFCLEQYSHLFYLPNLTSVDDDTVGTYNFICNDLTHAPTLLKEPGYYPFAGVSADEATCGFYKWKIGTKEYGEGSDLMHYHVNAAAMLLTSKWLDELKQLEVYDNTRIIIVSDHGAGTPTPAFNDDANKASFNPLLLVKDFSSHGKVQTDNTFMTNADAPIFAIKDLPVSNTNPFTGKNLQNEVDKSNIKISGYSVHDNIFDEANWKKIE